MASIRLTLCADGARKEPTRLVCLYIRRYINFLRKCNRLELMVIYYFPDTCTPVVRARAGRAAGPASAGAAPAPRASAAASRRATRAPAATDRRGYRAARLLRPPRCAHVRTDSAYYNLNGVLEIDQIS